MRALPSVLADLATPALAIAAFAALVACAAGPALDKRVPLREADARCPADLPALPGVPEFTISRAQIDQVAAESGLPSGSGRGVSGIYSPVLRSILFAADAQGWRLAHVRQWERCRAWLHRNTGSPLMAHEIRRGTPDGRPS